MALLIRPLAACAAAALAGGLHAADLRFAAGPLPESGRFAADANLGAGGGSESAGIASGDRGWRAGAEVLADLGEGRWLRPQAIIGAAWQGGNVRTERADHDAWALMAIGGAGLALGNRWIQAEAGAYAGLGFAEGRRDDLSGPRSGGSGGQGYAAEFGVRIGAAITLGSLQAAGDWRWSSSRIEIDGVGVASDADGLREEVSFSDRYRREGWAWTAGLGLRL